MAVQLHVLSRNRRAHAIGITQIVLDIQFGFPPNEAPQNVRDFLLAVDHHIENLFEGVFAEEKVQATDRIGIAIDFDGDQGRTFYKCARYSNDPVQQLFASITKVLQSNTSLMLRKWQIEIQIIRDLRGRGRKRPFSHEANKRMRSTVTIQSNDDLCLWRAIVVVRAHQEKQRLLQTGRANVANVRKNWRAMIRPNSGIQGEQARALKLASGTVNGDTDGIKKLSLFLQQNITLVNQNVSGHIEFRTIDVHQNFGDDTTICLLHSGNHFDAILKMHTFLGYHFYCHTCNVRSDHPGDHRCPNTRACHDCGEVPEEHTVPLPASLTCEHCFRSFTDGNCFEKHKSYICKKTWLCTDCERAYPHARKRVDHQCYEIKCRVCSEWVLRKHACYIQPKRAKKNLDIAKLKFYDFESIVDTPQHHIPNYGAVSSDGISFNCYENDGQSIIDAFVDGEFHEGNKNCTYIAHNASGYDMLLIKESLMRRGIQFECIPSGRKLVKMSIPRLNIHLIDSLNFISAPLSSFNKMFGLDAHVKKGNYCYEFNTLENWSYNGEMPPLQLFLPGGSHGIPYRDGEENEELPERCEDDEYKLRVLRNTIIKWWKHLKALGYRWNNYKELVEYCKNDVRVLALGELNTLYIIIYTYI